MYKNFTILLFSSILLTACDQPPTFHRKEPTPAGPTRNLDAYLHRAPFNNEWDPQKSAAEDQIVFTNVKQVFPFMGKLKNDNDDFKDYGKEPDLYRDKHIVYKDPEWGELFVYGALLYNNETVYIDKESRESGDLMFGGMQAASQLYEAALKETKLVSLQPNKRTAVYWVNSNNRKYLMLFQQQGQLVVEVGFTCDKEDKQACVDKLVETNKTLKLNSDILAHARVADLEVNESPVSFWKNPYLGMYPKESKNKLHLKLNNTPFKQQPLKISPEPDADYYFAYDGGTAWLTTQMKHTDLSRKEYFRQKHEGKTFTYNFIDDDETKVYVQEKHQLGRVTATAETYFKDNKILIFHYSYQERNIEIENYIEDMFKNIRITIW